MAHVTADRFGGPTQRVKLLIDQKIRGVALKSGDTCELPQAEALYLKNIDRVQFVAADVPKVAAR